MLLLHFFGGLLLGNFLATSGSFGVKSQLGFVDSVEESQVAMSL